ncbi:MAG: oligosaccharide repeat unit polymerase, partial [Actinomycetota bacterium]|nr:oligosaccharide repeat unit polymerase [Actinomycetota bacterium]
MEVDSSDYIRASLAVLLFVLIAVLVYSLPRNATSVRVSELVAPSAVGRAIAYWVVCVVLASLTLYYVVSSSGGLGAYLAGLANRRVFFEERGWGILVPSLVAPAMASLLVLCVATEALAQRKMTAAFVALTGIVGAVFLFLTGNRMNLVTFGVSAAVIFHKRIRRLRLGELVAGMVVIGLIVLSLPTYLRPAGGDPELTVRPVRVVVEDIEERGPVSDFGHLSAIAMIMSGHPSLDRQYGRTYLAGATIILPRRIAPWKLPGAGQVVTIALMPDLWLHAGTGIQVTAPGEAYLNFGWLGILMGGVAFGAGLRLVRRFQARPDPAGVLMFAILLPRVALFFRGEFANTLMFLLIELAFIGFGILIIERRLMTARLPSPAAA